MLIAAALLAGGCRGTARSSGPPRPSASRTSTTPAPTGPERTQPKTVLLPGHTYVTSKFRPRIIFTVREPWWLDGEFPTAMLLEPGSQPLGYPAVGFTDLDRVYPPSNQRVTVKAPKNMVAWFVHHPGWKLLVKPHPVQVGGLHGAGFDIQLVYAPTCNCPDVAAPGKCWNTWPGPAGEPGRFCNTDQGNFERDRIDVFRIRSRHYLLLAYGDYPESFASGVRRFEELLSTVRIEGLR